MSETNIIELMRWLLGGAAFVILTLIACIFGFVRGQIGDLRAEIRNVVDKDQVDGILERVAHVSTELGRLERQQREELEAVLRRIETKMDANQERNDVQRGKLYEQLHAISLEVERAFRGRGTGRNRRHGTS